MSEFTFLAHCHQKRITTKTSQKRNITITKLWSPVTEVSSAALDCNWRGVPESQKSAPLSESQISFWEKVI